MASTRRETVGTPVCSGEIGASVTTTTATSATASRASAERGWPRNAGLPTPRSRTRQESSATARMTASSTTQPHQGSSVVRVAGFITSSSG